MNSFDSYFYSLGIQTFYNTLGITDSLTKKYIGVTRKIVDNSLHKKSQNVKHKCYQNFFTDIEPRKKFTGFEQFEKNDFKFRIRMKDKIRVKNEKTLSFDNNENSFNTSTEYKDELISEIKKIKNPIILYLSGGLDSELVAKIFIEYNIKFLPVIFLWEDSTGNIGNIEEVKYAEIFCKLHNIIPHIEKINVKELWKTYEFENLALEMNILSTHVVTHGYMIKYINNIFPNHTHLFGGEVRYYIQTSSENNETVDIAFSLKTLSKNILYGYIPNPRLDFETPSLRIPNDGGTIWTTSAYLPNDWANMSVSVLGPGGAGGASLNISSYNADGWTNRVVAGGGGGGGGRLVTAYFYHAGLVNYYTYPARTVIIGIGQGGSGVQPGTGNGNDGVDDTGLYIWDNNNTTVKSVVATKGYGGGGGLQTSADGVYKVYGGLGGRSYQQAQNTVPANIFTNGGTPENGAYDYYGTHWYGGGGGGGGSTYQGDHGIGDNIGLHKIYGTGGQGGSGGNIIMYKGDPYSGNWYVNGGAGGGGGSAPTWPQQGGEGGAQTTGSTTKIGGKGGAGDEIYGNTNGQNAISYTGSGGGGAGLGLTSGNGSEGMVRLYMTGVYYGPPPPGGGGIEP